jgi:hypothetical protein
MATRKPKKPYYYAGGKRVELEPAADLVAVDDARLAEQLPDLLASDAALRAGKPLRGGIRLVERDALAPGTLDRLQSAGVTQPVFRQDSAIVIALPEIRIEDDSEAKLAQVRKFAESKVQPIADGAEGRLTLYPLSADGGDALSLANELAEQYKLASASPRFLRIVPGPVVRT